MVQKKKKKKMALYEVFSRGLKNSNQSNNLQALHPTPKNQSGPKTKFQSGIKRNVVTKPRMFQINRGRVEITLPTQLAVAVLLVVSALFLAAYRLGQWQGLKENDSISSEIAVENSENQAENLVEPTKTDLKNETMDDIIVVSSDSETGNNWVILASHKNREQLIPVQAFFSGHGIETQIRQKGKTFFLHTKQTYDNPQRSGTNGWLMKQKIIEIGSSYEPPPGYGNFDFRTVYGMKSFE